MTPTHTMRIPVRAWQVGEDGSLPEEVEDIAIRYGLDRDGDRWYYRDMDGCMEYANPGEWIVVGDVFGILAMTDADFRARCEEVRRGEH